MKTLLSFFISKLEGFLLLFGLLWLDDLSISDSISNEMYKTWLISGLVISGIFSIWVLIFSWINYDICISKNFIYRNSRISILESQFGYVFHRFLFGFMTMGAFYYLMSQLFIKHMLLG